MKEMQRLRKILKCCSIKTLQQFLENFDIPLINCKVSLTLTWSENCILTDITTQAARNANPNADPPVEGRERKQYNNILNNRHRIVCSSCYFIS